MGLFDKVLGFFGLESENGKKRKGKNVAESDKYSNFNLHVKNGVNLAPTQNGYSSFVQLLCLDYQQN